MRRAGWAAAAVVVGWYAFALWILHPLTQAPVVDSWLYASAVRRFLRTGEMRFAGFTQAMPIVQVLYGVGWSHAFGPAGCAVRCDVPCTRDQMRCAAMAGARGDGAADLQSMFHVPELFIHDRNSVLDGDNRGAPGVRQGRGTARAIVVVDSGRDGGDRIFDSAIRCDGDCRLRRRDDAFRRAAPADGSLGSRPVDQDDRAVRGRDDDLHRALDLADST